jgi:hypothetical protein
VDLHARPDWNDLPVKPVFLPFVHTITKYLADFSEPPASLTVGQVIPAPRKAGGGPSRHRGGTIAVAPSGARVTSKPRTARSSWRAGFYDVRTQGAGRRLGDDAREQRRLSESDLSPLDPRELAAAWRAARPASSRVGHRTAERRGAGPGAAAVVVSAGRGGLLLAAETLLSNRLSQNGARVS